MNGIAGIWQYYGADCQLNFKATGQVHTCDDALYTVTAIVFIG